VAQADFERPARYGLKRAFATFDAARGAIVHVKVRWRARQDSITGSPSNARREVT
jgi:hypothetical protein